MNGNNKWKVASDTEIKNKLHEYEMFEDRSTKGIVLPEGYKRIIFSIIYDDKNDF